MANYSKRSEELATHLKTESRYPALQAAMLADRLAGLYPARDSGLQQLKEVLCREDSDPIRGRVSEGIREILSRWVEPFSSSLDGASDPDESLDFWREAQVCFEGACFGRLAALDLGGERDAMLALETGLQKLTQDLQYKWDTMTEEARRLERLEAEASNRLTAAVQKALSDGTDLWKRWADNAQLLVHFFKSIGGRVNAAVVALAERAGFSSDLAAAIPMLSELGKPSILQAASMGITPGEFASRVPFMCRDPGMFVCDKLLEQLPMTLQAAASLINLSYGVLTYLSGQYFEQLSEYQRLIPNHGVVLVSLGQTQHQVDEYLKNNGLDKARAILDRASAGLSAWADGLPTEGQRADATAWKNEVLEPFKRRFERMSNLFGMFVQANQGRFIGGVSKKCEDELIFTDVWLDREENLHDIGMDERIREWRAENMRISEELRSASAQVASSLSALPLEIREDIVRRVTSLCNGMVETLEREAKTGESELQKAQATLAPERIRQDLNRAALKQKLAR